MTETKPYDDAPRVLSAQHCAFGDDLRGYCEQPATVHLWTIDQPGAPGDGWTMACDEHCGWFNTRKDCVVDHHPVTGPCGFPDTWWIYSHSVGGPGWCEMDGVDWLAAVEHADLPAEADAPNPDHEEGQ